MVGGGAGGAGGKIGAAQIEIHRDHAGRHVRDQHRDHERRQPARPTLQQHLQLLAGGLQAADAGAEEHADFVAIFRGEVQAGILQRAPRRIDAKLRIAVRAADFLGRREGGQRVEILHLAGDLRVKRRRVKRRDPVNAALAGDEILPEGVEVVAERGNDAHARDNHAAVDRVVCHGKIKRGSSGCG